MLMVSILRFIFGPVILRRTTLLDLSAPLLFVMPRLIERVIGWFTLGVSLVVRWLLMGVLLKLLLKPHARISLAAW